tara:strand:- start:441 stop:1109 length:669 start_codon:yes stop_codon:yes gene_type:complete
MVSMDKQQDCFYLNSEFQPASDMLRKCVGDSASPNLFNCDGDPSDLLNNVKETARMNDISIQRGFSFYNVDNSNVNHFTKDVVPKKTASIPGMEGFQNSDNIFITDNGPGKSSIPDGECPEGYSRCVKTGKCIQKCIGCVYRDNMKSRSFNEADPCFPEGTYDGVTNEGYVKCTCGSNNQYCSKDFVKNMYTTDGMMISGQKIIMNTGLTRAIDDLFNFTYL